jgi:hypothetical protein
MLTNNLKIRPDPQGDIVQQIAVKIYALDPHADCPHNPKEARALLDELQRKQRQPRPSGEELRVSQIYEVYNGLLPQLAKAKRLGIRSRDAKPPQLPANGDVSPDDLQVMTEFSMQLDIDIDAFEAQTPDQRRIAKLEADLAMAWGKLVRASNEHEARIAALEAIVRLSDGSVSKEISLQPNKKGPNSAETGSKEITSGGGQVAA